MLLRYKPKYLVGLEPSEQAHILRERFSKSPSVSIVHADGTHQPPGKFDFIFIVGVLHHIPEPSPVLRSVQSLLSQDGTLFVWVYGRENDMKLVVNVIGFLRRFTTKFPDSILEVVSAVITVTLNVYWMFARLCRRPRFPLVSYLEKVFIGCSFRKQVEIVFDQLNPECARFYTGCELASQLKESGFSSFSVVDRHGYSLSAIAKK
jgi:SAM-dependent methyltransferase